MAGQVRNTRGPSGGIIPARTLLLNNTFSLFYYRMDSRSPLSVVDKFRGNDIRIVVFCDSLFSQGLSMVFPSGSLAKIKAWPDSVPEMAEGTADAQPCHP